MLKFCFWGWKVWGLGLIVQGLSLRVDSAGFMVDGLRDDLQLQHERADGTI